MTKHTPATPLPWHQDEAHVASWIGGGAVPTQIEQTVAECFANTGLRDAAYIAHAANAYPRLVALAQKARLQADWPLAGEADALLRSLGED
jgi:hypothetical protein